MTGFYSQFGLELLSSIDFIMVEKKVTSQQEITNELEKWSSRKKTLFTNPRFIRVAIENIEKHLHQLVES